MFSKLKEFSPLFTAGIFFLSLVGVLLTGFGFMLGPVKANQARLENRLNQVDTRFENQLNQVESRFENRLNQVESRFENRLDRIEVKIDQFFIPKKPMIK